MGKPKCYLEDSTSKESNKHGFVLCIPCIYVYVIGLSNEISLV